jgi:hypothetical protein
MNDIGGGASNSMEMSRPLPPRKIMAQMARNNTTAARF